jgi:hypothetical protein
MNLAVELPVGLLDLSHTTDYDFIIASHCLSNKDYYDYYKSHRRSHTILDNGAFELGRSLTVVELRDICEALRPEMVVLPDVVDNAFQTRIASDAFLKAHPSPPFGLMGVLQGKSVGDYLDCLQWYAKQSSVTTIGIPYHQFNRAKFIKKYTVDQFCREFGLSIHILGLPNPFEAVELAQIPEVVSIDTSLPAVSALNKKDMRAFQWLSARLDITAVCDAETSLYAQRNIALLRAIVRGSLSEEYVILSKNDMRLDSYGHEN